MFLNKYLSLIPLHMWAADPDTPVVDRGDTIADADPAPAHPTPTDAAADTDDFEAGAQAAADDDDAATADKDAADKDAADKDAPDKKRIRIPKERLDQEIDKRRKAEERAAQRIAELERQVAQNAVSADIAGLEKQIAELDEKYERAIVDGESKLARELRAESRLLERQLTQALTAEQANRARIEAVSELKYDAELNRIEAAYPKLNPDNEDTFDADLAAEVAEVMNAFKRSGSSPADALRRAVRYVAGPPPSAKTTKEDPAADGLRRTQQESARRKAAEAVTRTPPSTRDVGLDSDKVGDGGKKPAVTDMTFSQFAVLSDEQKRELRGDTV